ncbi:MAG: SRPBCC domain-containing protein [Planctomycetes bacterium]|nr:SRPBCC domain-containing protein [Planctomycetota bacterium]
MPTEPSLRILDAKIAIVELDLVVAAPRKRVWKALVDETSLWWRKDFYIGKRPKGMVFEPRVGGRMYEDWGDGAGVLWATVFGIAHETSFDLRGEISPAFGGPRTWQLHCELKDHPKGTLVKLVDASMGKIDAEGAQAVRDGWEMLFGEGGLKGFVES